MFQAIEGHENPVNLFYDNGCSNAIFKVGIPVKELKGTLLAKGPFQMGGVGDLTTRAEDEWLVQVNRVDGKKQIVQGVTMKQITCDFPAIDTTEAVAEVKGSNKEDKSLQSCMVPKIAGGTVHVLLGIQYLNIFPEVVMQLEFGLTIFRSRLVSHDKKMNAIIGGPHSSFQFLADKFGNTAALLAHFTEGLSRLRQLGPPKIPVNPMTVEEEMFAKAHNAAELREVTDTTAGVIGLSCSRCFYMHMEESAETLREIRKLRIEQESGLDLNYRCIKCRDCSTCRDADRTEAISLREEAEMEQIDQSVKLDLEKKQITCSLPLKGEERDYLTTNYSQALKILEQQVKQYSSKKDTKESIIKAWQKLFDNGHAVLMDELTDEERESFIRKEVQYFIPWRVAFSDSVTTPARPVLDASSRTRMRPDGSGGKSLNNLLCSGKVETINLLKLILGFLIGEFAVTGDLQQFYNACKLLPMYWNLQRFLFKADLDPSSPVVEGVIKTLIYGVVSVAAQSENAMHKLGQIVKDDKPEVKKLIEKKRYVDDLADSKATKEECQKLAKDASEVFNLVNLKCKSWTFSGEDPDLKISKDGISIGVGGFTWYPKLDVFTVKVPLLHFEKKKRGRLPEDTQFFSGTMLDLDKFTPKNLTRRMVTSKFASIFDPTNKFGPVLAASKDLLRDTIEATEGWDTAMPEELRSKWLLQFMQWEKLRGLQFNRAVMPVDAVDGKLRLIVLCDAANKMLVIGCWGGFRRSTGEFSCQHLLSRTLLAEKNSTIPKGELQSLTNASNMCWLLRKMLEEWVDSYIICGDSVIALCWVSSEKKSLGMYHRNRVIQIRRGSELEHLYHVVTEENLADLGTRPDKVKISEVGPESEWECGKSWMLGEISSAVEQGILKPVSQLRLGEEKDCDEYREGLVFNNDIPDIFCNAVGSRVDQLQLRAEFSNYLVFPTHFGFKKGVRIISLVLTFISKCRRKVLAAVQMLETKEQFKFSVFHTAQTIEAEDSNPSTLLTQFRDKWCNTDKMFILCQTDTSLLSVPFPTDKYIHQALVYLYRKAAREVIKFNPAAKVDKMAIMKDGILFSKGRIIDGMNFVQTGGLELTDLGQLGIKAHIPVVDRHSPLAYSIANHVHWNLAKHRGVETCNRMSLGHVNILQGASLYKEIGEECVRCRMKRKRYLEMPMGPISDHQLRICPPFWACQADMFGPYLVYVPGFERNTRNRKVLEAKCWVMCFVCPVTRLTNLQVIEKSDHSGVIDSITRLSCEVGIPKFMMIDQDTALMKALQEVEMDMVNTQLKLHRECGIEFSTCPVSGHNQHGQVERRIRSVQESLSEAGLETKRLHATGLQTMMKLVENQLNNLPLGYSYGRDQDNTPLLKMLTPNMLRVGRNNERALDGPMRMPSGGGELLEEVQKVYDSWFKVWNVSYIPKLLYQPKWWKQDRDLKDGDIVMFQKTESELDSKWTLGTVDQLVRGRDGLVRRAVVRYQNYSEDFHRLSDRHTRRLVKIWSVDDQNIDQDLAELQRRLEMTERGSALVVQLLEAPTVLHLPAAEPFNTDGEPAAFQSSPLIHSACGFCCCDSHCRIGHQTLQKPAGHVLVTLLTKRVLNPILLLPSGHLVAQEDHVEDDVQEEDSIDGCECSLTSILNSLSLNLA